VRGTRGWLTTSHSRLAGPAHEQPPSADALADELSAALARDIDVDPRVRLEVQDVSGD